MNFEEKYVMLKMHPCFKNLPASDLAVIANASCFYEFQKGAIIAIAHTLATHLFIIAKGSISSGSKTNSLMFCPQAVLDASEYKCDAFSDKLQSTECLVLTRQHFMSAVKNCPTILVSYIENTKDLL